MNEKLWSEIEIKKKKSTQSCSVCVYPVKERMAKIVLM
jgi:hypothetical protein